MSLNGCGTSESVRVPVLSAFARVLCSLSAFVRMLYCDHVLSLSAFAKVEINRTCHKDKSLFGNQSVEHIRRDLVAWRACEINRTCHKDKSILSSQIFCLIVQSSAYRSSWRFVLATCKRRLAS